MLKSKANRLNDTKVLIKSGLYKPSPNKPLNEIFRARDWIRCHMIINLLNVVCVDFLTNILVLILACVPERGLNINSSNFILAFYLPIKL